MATRGAVRSGGLRWPACMLAVEPCGDLSVRFGKPLLLLGGAVALDGAPHVRDEVLGSVAAEGSAADRAVGLPQQLGCAEPLDGCVVCHRSPRFFVATRILAKLLPERNPKS